MSCPQLRAILVKTKQIAVVVWQEAARSLKRKKTKKRDKAAPAREPEPAREAPPPPADKKAALQRVLKYASKEFCSANSLSSMSGNKLKALKQRDYVSIWEQLCARHPDIASKVAKSMDA